MKRLLTIFVSSVLVTILASAQPKPAYRWAGGSEDFCLNHNPTEAVCASIPCIVPYHSDYTVVAVYTTGADTAERMVWTLCHGAAGDNGLSTRRLIFPGSAMQYDSVNRRGPVINSLMQSSPVDDTLDAPDSVTLFIGGVDTACGGLRVAEVMYFKGRTGFSALRMVQTHLAVKYGVTLGAGDYVSPDGRHLWRYRLDSAWHHRVTGVGVDSVYGLSQPTSRSGHDGALLTISADSLGEGEYCLIGDDGAPMEYAVDSEHGTETLRRTWKARVTRNGDAAEGGGTLTFRLVFSTQGTDAEGDTLALLVDGDMYYPDSVTNGDNCFSRVEFPSDTALLRLVKASSFGMRGYSPAFASDNGVSVSISPNPCRRRYTVSVDGCGSVDIEVHNTSGVKVGGFSGRNRGMYRFDGVVPVSGVYYITVTADGVRRTLKMVAD